MDGSRECPSNVGLEIRVHVAVVATESEDAFAVERMHDDALVDLDEERHIREKVQKVNNPFLLPIKLRLDLRTTVHGALERINSVQMPHLLT